MKDKPVEILTLFNKIQNVTLYEASKQFVYSKQKTKS